MVWSKCFTLLELLVVIAIIVVLLTILTPALDTAIYKAKLTACASNLDALGAAAPAYGAQYNRYYFYRPAVRETGIGYYMPRSLNIPFNSAQTKNIDGYDDRKVMEPFMNIDALQCPLAGKVSLARSSPNTYIESSYSIFVGWMYTPPEENEITDPEYERRETRGMFKLGQKMRWDKWDFYVLAGDVTDVVWTGWWNAHPDKKGVLAQVEEQELVVDMSGRGDLDAQRTRAGWYGNVFSAPGRVDSNWVWHDGSVRLLDDMSWNPREPVNPWQREPEPRTKPLPSFKDYKAPDNLNLLSAPPGP